jgi:hypothetical protein
MLVMELVPGAPLRGPVPLEVIVNWPALLPKVRQ